MMSPQHPQDEVYNLSIEEPEAFWSKQASYIHWHKKPPRALEISTKKLANGVEHPTWKWFPGGEISNCYNCLDRHVEAGNGDNVAIYWDSPVSGSKETYTYKQVLREVEILAGVLREEGVRKGDVVIIYSRNLVVSEDVYTVLTTCLVPMIPSALFAMLAINRLGAIHAVVFGGFSPPSLAQRLEASRPRVIMTASCGIEGGKGAIGYRSLITKAVEKSSFKPQKIIVWQRDQMRWDPIVKESGERNWQRLVKSARNRGLKADAVPVGSNEAIYIIYTSGILLSVS
jgi:propionyl-CoA synthetase